MLIIKNSRFYNISPYKAHDTTHSKQIWIQNVGMVPKILLAKDISKQVTGYVYVFYSFCFDLLVFRSVYSLFLLFRLASFHEHMQSSNVCFYNTPTSL